MQFCLVPLVIFAPVVGFWICDVCVCHFRMCVNGEGLKGCVLPFYISRCQCWLCLLEVISWTSIYMSDEITLLKRHSKTEVLCSSHVNIQKIPQWITFCALLSIFLSLSGVPRQHRGEIWKFLSEQYLLRKEVPSTKPHNNDTPYKELLKQLTSQQHAILIDLG